ncbi:hypothetical protein SAMN05421756_1096 [Microlunatus flavus]|uniref:Uncharacterized protein n=1 Tax=Microlunatus flavus TaxID=1036181 RepID=A0A1H9LL30_9ACTN|nr:hypothetical protein SAMN05421756_1096 [Microlunatus flavus]
MLREGGHYRPRSDLYLTKGRRPTDPPWFRGVPRRPREYEYYPGEFVVEPDPNVSNDRTTGHLIRVMLLRGWSRNQIAYEMSLVRNKGGAWLRWQRDSDRALDRFVEGTKLPERNPPIPSPKEEAVVRPSGLVIVPGIALRFLDFIETEPRSMTDLVERGPMKDSRNGRGVAREYVDYLTEEGMIRWVPGWRTRPRGPVPNFLAVVVHPDPEA